ncbi:glycosyltransferase family 8 protein [Marinilactibacillus psychrotolerans]|uniref:Lipopolysaccharide biosynthesis glycosyltransferase n=1 Tax=Marinilactibacillus psychrotolerans TaxID=191770 RepID=A0AAV3WRK9_9LACT|nr:glycosyltransferase family 8 protein [Marinilactibacillus psychrotolerans]GEL66571.1 glycosyl transferase [Marinilactibacillus psychrotolerans]GEQ35093.1 lipopolysaccharide biosynthesis glycosyltransferase [Marinilactibacillus psychrotolerans]SDD22073.1 Lipopolysaccharide biosynthesis protein, LPS:glycosyltransferase [Marinilactibacillus psychrotolerans]
MKDKIDILVTLDESYLDPLKVMLTSLHQNNRQTDFRIWLIHERISSEKLRSLQTLLKFYEMELKVIKVPQDLFSDAPTAERYPKEMYYRLACGNLLPESVKRVIYLDPDTLIINSIKELWEVDLEGNILAAATHSGLTNITKGINNIRLGTNRGYFNSGIMVIDVEQARSKVQIEDIYDTIRKYSDYLLLPDQDVMNYLYGEFTKEIPEEIWNYDTRQSSAYFTRSFGAHNTHWVAGNTVILHYCGKPKPWNEKSNNRFTLLYLHYQQLLKRYEENI